MDKDELEKKRDENTINNTADKLELVYNTIMEKK